jgi:hypothetical protein
MSPYRLMPSNKKEVQSFVGFVNFYQCFIPGFSHYARALFDLTMKDVRFIWGLPQEDSFMKLKELITSAPVLVLPNDDLPFRLEADSSGDTPQAPSPRVDRSQLKLSNAYWSSYAECPRDDTLHMQSQRHFTLHSYASNSCNTRRSWSVPPIIVYTLVSYDTT